MDGEASIARAVAFVEDRQYAQLMVKKAKLPETKWGDAIGCPGPQGSPAAKASQAIKSSRR